MEAVRAALLTSLYVVPPEEAERCQHTDRIKLKHLAPQGAALFGVSG